MVLSKPSLACAAVKLPHASRKRPEIDRATSNLFASDVLRPHRLDPRLNYGPNSARSVNQNQLGPPGRLDLNYPPTVQSVGFWPLNAESVRPSRL